MALRSAHAPKAQLDKARSATLAAAASTIKASGDPGYHGGLAAKNLLALDGLTDVHNVSGIDLSKAVTSSIRPSGMVQGSPEDTPGTFPQALAVMAVSQNGSLTSPAGRKSLTFLLHQQCRPGWFHYLSNDSSDCDKDHGQPDVDSTALSILALDAASNADPSDSTIPAARDRAVAWLATQQLPNGGFATSAGDEPNANTTGLAAAALAPHRPSATHKAADWVAHSTLTSGPDAGAIRYMPSQADKMKNGQPIPDDLRDTTVLSTAQAIMAFAPTNPAHYSNPAPACRAS
ncbi:hypothetical protein FYJ43_11505 [Cutibacterium sp. WCA-380-WT-3A]|uniref:Terpene cyclase/mutase family protein n=1 Tax=Cutibacterium porci TaxID=2605781 RepID=A0A7K0J9G9_9ACTN|nr:hypothetical protein [Cutibacterium porci]MSS46624.1 hypothetical protein [Cutibacterium porci]